MQFVDFYFVEIREQLKVYDIKNDIEKNRLKWYGHVMCMADERIPKRTLEMKCPSVDACLR
jgi:hypothetical protein